MPDVVDRQGADSVTYRVPVSTVEAGPLWITRLSAIVL